MLNKDILKKALEKALKNGLQLINERITRIDTDDIDKIYIHFYDEEGHQSDMFAFNTWKLIFSHDFARCFWKSDWTKKYVPTYLIDVEGKITLKRWEYELQQMVISENPIKYLEQFL